MDGPWKCRLYIAKEQPKPRKVEFADKIDRRDIDPHVPYVDSNCAAELIDRSGGFVRSVREGTT